MLIIQGESKWEIKAKGTHYVYSLDRASSSLPPLEQYFRPVLNEIECNNHVKAFSYKSWTNPATNEVITPHHINPIFQLILLQAQKYLGPNLSYVAFNDGKLEDEHIVTIDDLQVITLKNLEVNKAAFDLGFPEISILHRFPTETNLDYSKRLTLFNKFIVTGVHISDSPFKGVYLGDPAFSYMRKTTANYDQFHSMLKIIHFLLHPIDYNDRVYGLVLHPNPKTGWTFPSAKFLDGSILDSRYSFRNSVLELLKGTYTLSKKTTFGDRKCSDVPFKELVSWECIARGCDANLKAESETGTATALRAKRGKWTKQLLEPDTTVNIPATPITAVPSAVASDSDSRTVTQRAQVTTGSEVTVPVTQTPQVRSRNRNLDMLSIDCSVGNPTTDLKRRRFASTHSIV